MQGTDRFHLYLSFFFCAFVVMVCFQGCRVAFWVAEGTGREEERAPAEAGARRLRPMRNMAQLLGVRKKNDMIKREQKSVMSGHPSRGRE